MWYATNLIAGSDTVTVNYSVASGASLNSISWAEYSGLATSATLDVSSSASGTSLTADTGSFGPTTATNELVVGAAYVATTVSTAGTGFTLRATTSGGNAVEDKNVTSTGNQDVTFNLDSSGGWAAIGATFKAASTTSAGSYNQSVFATGGTPPYTWLLQSGTLPTGTSLTTTGTPANAVISGPLTASGTFNFSLKVTDSALVSATKAYTVTVSGNPLVLTTTTIPNGTVGVAYSTTFTATGGTAPDTWSVSSGTLPGGLSLNSSTGTLSGTPTVSGSFSFGILVTDANGQTASRNFNFSIAVAASGNPTISSVSPTSGTAGTSVTVNGANFVSGAVVAFGGTNATSTTFVNSTQLTASVPSIAVGTYDVKVTNPDTSNATLPQGFSVTAAQSLLSGMTPAHFTVPAGWTLVRTQDFESGSLGSGEVTCGAATSITTTNPHTGSRSLQGTYAGDGQRICWALQSGVVNSAEVYISFYVFWESQGRYNDEFELARFLKNDSGGNLLQEVVVDQISIGNASNTGNMTNTNLVVIPQGILSAGGFTHAYWENATNLNNSFGVWIQYEIHFKANTPGSSDGVMEIFKNGALNQQIVNANFNGTLSMTDMLVFIQDVYTKLTWLRADNSCGAFMGDGADRGPRVFDFTQPCNCTAQCPPSGSVPIFKTYIDDIIVLKK